jgi:murein DD-endopeptidase MepM/ murein hydrolase activator NlpD
MIRQLTPALLLTLTAACASSPTAPGAVEVCGGFGDWRTSLYVLPYPAGAAYVVDQANCSAPGNGHRGAAKFGYDFLMPIGTPLVAARGGTVIHVEQSHFDGQVAATGFDNWIVLLHDDGTTGLYGHITHNGSEVVEGQVVAQGGPIGRSGNTGNTANKPHLHFSVAPCDPIARGTAACPTLPVNFRNTGANPDGLAAGVQYLAGV